MLDNTVDLRLVLSGIFSILRHGNLFFQMQCRVSSAQTVRQDGFAGKIRSLRAVLKFRFPVTKKPG